MKTNYSKICTRKNTAMLLVGFLTPVVLFTSLTVSMFNSGDSKDAEKTTQKYAVEKVYLTDELSAAPKAYFYDKDGNGEDESVTIHPDADNICLKGALLPNLNRF